MSTDGTEMVVAYSNWGAFVHKDGERREDREDVAVFDDDEKDLPSGARIFGNLMKLREKYPTGNPPWWEHSHHAVLGDGPIRITGYKDHAELYEISEDGTVTNVDLAPFKTGGGEYDPVHEGEYKGVSFTCTPLSDNLIDLTLVEADGSKWSARCGSMYGAGHMEYPGT